MPSPTADLPLITADLPGTGGILRAQPEDFRVVELPAYDPSGEGDHVLVTIEKRGLTTFEAVRRLADALGARASDIGSAGLKDRHAVTEQQLSLPPPCSPEAALAAEVEDLRVLRAARHPHKLKTGHLRGNRFTITVRETAVDAETAAERAAAVLARLAAAPGSPNWYGEQRFGRGGDNATVGRALVLGQKPPGRPPRGRQRRLYISAYQSLLFNEVLRRRIADDLYRTVIAGDVMQKLSGGAFVSDDAATDQARLDAGEIVPTGPMFGPKMKSPTAEAAAREAAVLADDGVTIDDFARVGKLAAGTRRPLAIPLGAVAARVAGDRAVEVCFELPAGAYATAVLAEIVKGSQPC